MPKRIFIAFAKEDITLRDFLVGQRDNVKTPIEFTDMSVKEPWSTQWKTNCRSRIRGCDGMIGLITKNSVSADGQIWELQCSIDESVPLYLVHGYKNQSLDRIPSVISGRRIHIWTWDGITEFVKST